MATTNGAGQPDAQQRSTGELVKELADQVTVLVKDELKLAQIEMKTKGKQAGTGAGMMGGGGLIALYGVGCLIACAIIGISHAVQAWLAALIVGAALLAVAAVAATAGRGRLKSGTPPVPTQTAESIKTDVEAIRERARR
jgi:uncharacterized membrane protein YqjE